MNLWSCLEWNESMGLSRVDGMDWLTWRGRRWMRFMPRVAQILCSLEAQIPDAVICFIECCGPCVRATDQ